MLKDTRPPAVVVAAELDTGLGRTVADAIVDLLASMRDG